MIIVRAKDRNYIDRGWMRGYRSFSFQDYYDEDQDCFCSLLVLNDEEFAPARGFNIHPTSDIEVITYVEKGELEVFNDQLSGRVSLKEGEMQILSYGEATLHSEINNLPDGRTSFLQFWFTPSKFGAEPFHCIVSPSEEEIRNRLFLAFSQKKAAAGKIGQDVNFYLSFLEKGKTLEFESLRGRGMLIFILEGELQVGEELLFKRDSLRTTSSGIFPVEAKEDCKFFLIDTK
ncbi:MAG: pirin family protein [Peptostreptococcaceae bacterium]|nr:pirin family protein [Peptostreptococcaceae bacterium]